MCVSVITFVKLALASAEFVPLQECVLRAAARVCDMALRPPSNREALRLYREILRTCKAFYWNNEKGEPWYAPPAGHALVWDGRGHTHT